LVFEVLKNDSHPLKHDDAEFNVLNDVIDTLRFRGSIFFHSYLAAPWGMSLKPISTPRFHIALEGGFFVGVSDQQVNVRPMDIVLIPNGDMHWIADEKNRELVASEQAGKACELGMPMFQNGEITNKIMCGVVEYDAAVNHPIFSALPSALHLGNIHDNDSIWITVQLIDAEIRSSNSIQNSVIDRLTEVLFIKLLNRFVEENRHLTGFLAALREPRITKVLQLIHKHPEQAWTLENLGEKVGMSRATLQRKFKVALATSPMTYLNHWRIAKAYNLIKYSSLSLDVIAENIGFADARTLRRAFSRHYGLTPSALRKTDRNDAA
jgi:AraC-like DNA-binding protein